MDYLLSCTCGKEHVINASQAGQNLACSCGETIAIPTFRGLRALPAATREDIPPTVANEHTLWKTWRGPAIAVATGASVIALLFSAWFLLQLLRIDTSHTTEKEISVGNAIFDEYSPEELSLIWNNYQSEGIGEKKPPMYQYMQSYATARKYLAGINGGIGGLFAMIAVGIRISAPTGRRKQPA